jgi:hypothetical protein
LASSREGKGLAEYYGGTFGPKNYRDLFGPAFRAVVCQPPDDFPAELLFRKKPRRQGVPKSFTLPQGLGEIAQAIADQDGLDAAPESADLRGDPGRRRLWVSLSGGDEILCDALTLAVPPDAAAALIPPGLPEASALVAGIGVAEIETLVMAVPARDLECCHLPPMAGLIAVDDVFYSAVSRDYAPDPLWRGFAFHFQPGVMGHAERLMRLPGLGVDGMRWRRSPMPIGCRPCARATGICSQDR